MGKLFGTDGVRGKANVELTCELAMDIGRALATVLREKKDVPQKPRIMIGMDTRISGDLLGSAISAGLCSAGADVFQVGVVPTPAVAFLVRKYEMDAGVMISASHNPFADNGIKIFSGDGFKLSDAQEEEMEDLILEHSRPFFVADSGHVGQIFSLHEHAVDDYTDYIVSTAQADFSGIRIAVDCSNGSASATAEKIFSRLGAECTYLNDCPDGMNINDRCGSTHMEGLMEAVRTGKYDLGLAFDGDADRCLAVDAQGELIDGDQIIAICAKQKKEQGALRDNCVVVTVMSNLGFFHFAKENGIKTEITKVGDRYVLENMIQNGYQIGGEQSGHIIFSDYMTTGDGQLSAVQLLSILKGKNQSLAELASVMKRCPQVLQGYQTTKEGKEAFASSQNIQEYLERRQRELGERGRILVRASGTEPLIRVMVEGEDPKEIEAIAQEIIDVLRREI